MSDDLIKALQKELRQADDRIAELQAALKPFARKNLSDEITTTTLEYLSPLGTQMKELQKMKESDDNIRAARKVLEKNND